jgi:subtilase family serine protease
VSIRGGAVVITPDNMPDSLARTGSYTVKGNENCTVPQADLTLAPSDIATYTQKGKGGPQVVVAAVVHNAGTADATGVQVQFAADGQTFSTQTIPRIAKGGTVRLTAGWSSKGQKGNHTFTVTADSANAITESNEGNNSASVTVTVK